MANTSKAGKSGSARHPHDSRRPESAAVKLGVEIFREEGNVEPLRSALSPRQRSFCEEYIVDYNGSAAAIRAGYAIPYADRQAHVLLKNMGVAAYIDYLNVSKEAKITALTPDYLIQQLMTIITKAGVRDGDKIRSIELLMKHSGMFIERTEITGKDGEAIKIEQQVKQEADKFLETIRRISEKGSREPKKDATII